MTNASNTNGSFDPDDGWPIGDGPERTFSLRRIVQPAPAELWDPVEAEWSHQELRGPKCDVRGLPAPLSVFAKPASKGLLTRALERSSRRYGVVSCHFLRIGFTAAIEWAEKHYVAAGGNYEAFANRVLRTSEKRFQSTYGWLALKRERRDQDLRDSTLHGDSRAIVTYLDHLDGRLLHEMRLRPARWSVPGVPAEEVRRDSLAHVYELLRGGGGLREHERLKPGREVGLAVAGLYRWTEWNKQHRRARLHIAMSPDEIVAGQIGAQVVEELTPEILVDSRRRCDDVRRAVMRVSGRLTKKQNEVLGAVLEHLQGTSAKVVPAAIARDLHRDRTVVSKAWTLIRARLADHLEKHRESELE